MHVGVANERCDSVVSPFFARVDISYAGVLASLVIFVLFMRLYRLQHSGVGGLNARISTGTHVKSQIRNVIVESTTRCR